MAQRGGIACPCPPNVLLRVGRVADEPRGPGHVSPSRPSVWVRTKPYTTHSCPSACTCGFWWWSEQERARTSREGPSRVWCRGPTACGRPPRGCPQGKGCGLLPQNLPSQAEGPGLLTPAVELHCGALRCQVTDGKTCAEACLPTQRRKQLGEKAFMTWFIKLNVGFWKYFNLVFCLLVQDVPGLIDGKTSDRGRPGTSAVWLLVLGPWFLFFTVLF